MNVTRFHSAVRRMLDATFAVVIVGTLSIPYASLATESQPADPAPATNPDAESKDLPQPAQPEPPAVRPPAPTDDPTRPSPELLKALEAERDSTPQPQAAQQATAIPDIVLRGRLILNEAAAEALIEVDGTIHRVISGEKRLFTSSRGSLLVEVLEVSHDQVRLKLPSLAEPLTLR